MSSCWSLPERHPDIEYTRTCTCNLRIFKHKPIGGPTVQHIVLPAAQPDAAAWERMAAGMWLSPPLFNLTRYNSVLIAHVATIVAQSVQLGNPTTVARLGSSVHGVLCKQEY